MWTNQTRLWRFTLCVLFAIGTLAYTVAGDDEVPSESQCRPYIEKALKGLETGESQSGSVENNDSQEAGLENETKEDTSAEEKGDGDDDDSSEDGPSIEVADEPYVGQESAEALGAEVDDSKEDDSKEDEADQDDSQATDDGDSKEVSADDDTAEKESKEDQGEDNDGDSGEADDDGSQEGDDDDKDDDGSDEKADDDDDKSDEATEGTTTADAESGEDGDDKSEEEADGDDDGDSDEKDDDDKDSGEEIDVNKKDDDDGDSKEDDDGDSKEDDDGDSKEDDNDDSKEDSKDDEASAEDGDDDKSGDVEDDGDSEEKGKVAKEVGDDEKSGEDDEKSGEDDEKSGEVPDDKSGEDEDSTEETAKKSGEDNDDEKSGEDTGDKSGEDADGSHEKADGDDDDSEEQEENGSDEDSDEGAPEEDLLKVGEIPDNLRSRDHIVKILRLDEDASEAEITIERSADIVLRDLKRLYENAIKPLETLYKYRDLSNRHFGDPEIFSKPLVLFMGPWSGGKSSLINYLTGLEFTEWSLRTGAEPSPAYFNILMYGKEPEVLDGTQLAADWTFSGLQKFGQGLEERLRGLRYPSKLLEKVNIVEIPGILEVRKQVSRVFPFNDACQWFIDRADIIFLVYDPSKLDVGPETEAILDQLKGRESQTRILLNKADTVKPEELMRVQSALIWNISPLMSSAQPPVMYTASLWSMPFEAGAPVRLLQAQERELLRDLRTAVDRRIDNKIASARRFAVRVRNHAKMVDCYLTTYYNHKTIFGNKKLIADAIIENPQNYHIYEGLSTLTNISRYDLPDPETYRDFFRLNPIYEFQQLSATCTYFRGCPINRLDVAIAYDFPELVGKHKKMVETATPQGMPKS